MNKLFKNISWLFFDKVLRIVGGLFVGVWVARYLGPNDFGILNYSLAYTALFMVFVNLGFDQIVVRELVKFPERTNELLGTAFTLKLLGGIVGVIAVACSLFLSEIDILTKTIIFIMSLTFIARSFDVIDFFFQSKVLSKYVVIARNAAFILSSLLKIFLIVNEYNVIYFAMVNCLDFFTASFLFVIIYSRTGSQLMHWRFNVQISKKIVSDCWPLAISVFLISVHMRIDQVMIGNMLDTEQVGIYSVAVRLSEAWYFIPGIIVSTFMPYFVELKEKNNFLYYDRLIQLYSFMFWMGVVAGCFTLLWGKDLVKILFGDNYVDAQSALVFNIWNGIFISQAIARGIWMISENLQRYRLYNNLIMVTLNIFLNMKLIPLFGITGSAIATLLTQFIGTWIVSFLWKPLHNSTFAMIKSINPIYLIKGLKNLTTLSPGKENS